MEEPADTPQPKPPAPPSPPPGGIAGARRRRAFGMTGSWAIPAAVLAALLAASMGFWFLRPPEITVLEIRPQPTEIVLSVVGRVRPANLVDVRSQNAGQIVKMMHDDGDLVEAGEPLALIRSVVEQAQADAGSARQAAARAELSVVQLAFDRTRFLVERGIASEAALDEARAELEARRAALAAAAADQRAASAQTGEFTIRAPMAGIILVRPVDEGQVISPEVTLFQLGSRGAIEVHADVDEVYADTLRPGMAARAVVSGSDEVFAASISEVSPRIDPGTGGRLIKLAPASLMDLPPGRSVDVTIIIEQLAAAISIPREAVIGAANAPSVLVVGPGGRVSVRAVRIRDWPSLNAVVEAGLASGEMLVLEPGGARPGARVRLRIQAAAPAKEG